MTKRQLAAKLVDENLAFLQRRGGFDGWWDDIRPEDREELLTKWINEIEGLLNEPATATAFN